MDEKLIEVTVRKDGTIQAETHNIRGSKCLDYIAILEDLLDAEATSSAFTSDYTESAAAAVDEAPAVDRLGADE